MPTKTHAKANSPHPFIAKLLDMLNNPALFDIIRWTPDGRAVHVVDELRLCKEVLPLMFRHNNMASFCRQMHLYSFSRHTEGAYAGCFFLEPFRRDRPDLAPFFVRFGDRRTRERLGLTGPLSEEGQLRYYGQAAAPALAPAMAMAMAPKPVAEAPKQQPLQQSWVPAPQPFGAAPLMLKKDELSFDAELLDAAEIDDVLSGDWAVDGMDMMATPPVAQAPVPQWGWGAVAATAAASVPAATTSAGFDDWLPELGQPILESGFSVDFAPQMQRQHSLDVEAMFD